MSARGISSTVIQHNADREDICLRHHRWLAASEQYPLDRLPGALTANRRQRTLTRRAGATTAEAYRDGHTTVTAWFTAADHADLHCRWIHRLRVLPEDPLGQPGHPSPQRIALAVYPDAVALAATIGLMRTDCLAHGLSVNCVGPSTACAEPKRAWWLPLSRQTASRTKKRKLRILVLDWSFLKTSAQISGKRSRAPGAVCGSLMTAVRKPASVKAAVIALSGRCQ